MVPVVGVQRFSGKLKKVRTRVSFSMVAPFYDIPVHSDSHSMKGCTYNEIEQDRARLGDWDEGLKRANPTAA